MQSSTYIGMPITSGDKSSFTVDLNTQEQEIFNNIAKLSLEISDGSASAIIADHDGSPVFLGAAGKSIKALASLCLKLAKSCHAKQLDLGNLNNVDPINVISQVKEKYGQSLKELENLEQWKQVLLIPIVMPSGLVLGTFVIVLHQLPLLSERQLRLLSVLRRDAVNQLLLKRKSLEIAANQELQNLILENNEDWIFVKDRSFKLVYANQAFLNVYPEEMRDKVIGYTTVEEYSKEEADIFLEQDRIAFEHGISEVLEDLHMPDGTSIVVNTIKRRFRDHFGQEFILCVCRNVTEKEMLIRDLKKAYEDLDEFTNIASHDLKSPLNAIHRLLEWIQEDCEDILPEESRENLDLVINRATRMRKLLEDLLTYSRIGRVAAEPESFELSQMVKDLDDLIDRPLAFSVTSDNMLLKAPKIPFRTVLLNLVSNAIKHNDKESGTVEVTGFETKHDYVIKVKDNGPGIEDIYFERIFGVFETLQSRDESEGSGIGLSVVAKYVKTFGGEVSVESDGKSWTCFTVSWPKLLLKKSK